MDRSLRNLSLRIAALPLAALLAGCGDGIDGKPTDTTESKPNGIEDLDPAAAMREAADATRYVKDLTLEGSGPFPFPSGSARADIRIDVTKKGDCEVVMKAEEFGTITTRQVSGTTYIRTGVKGWTAGFGAPAANARLLADRWLSQPTGEEDRSCSIFELSAQTIDADTCTGGEAGEVGGTPTLAFECKESGGKITVHLSTIGEPLAYRIHGVDEDGPFDLRLVDHDSRVLIVDPPKRSVIDGTQLQQ